MGFLTYVRYKPLVTLTEKGAAVDVLNFDVKKEVREKAAVYWEENQLRIKRRIV